MIKPFHFKEFSVSQDKAAMKIGTDAVLLGAWCGVKDGVDSILDIGAGTGVIALMLAQRSEAMTIDAVELDEGAYEQCVENFEQSDWGDRLYCYHSSFQDFSKEIAEEEESYDLIVSNPPYYTDDFKTKDEARNKARFTSSLSFEDLLSGVTSVLANDGVFAVVIPFKEYESFVNVAKNCGLFLIRKCCVQGNKDSAISRCLLEFSFTETILIDSEMAPVFLS